MRLSILVLAISLACSNSSAMWRPNPKPQASGSGLINKLEVVAVVAFGIWILIADGGIIEQLFEDPPRFNPDEDY